MSRSLVVRGGVVLAGILTAWSVVAGPASAEVVPHSERPGAQTSHGHGTHGIPVPTIFGHRGAAGYRPEHTASGYDLAVKLGADFLEPDLVPTRDGQLVDRHEPEISMTTDVASHPEFADRKRTVTIDGVAVTGWFTFDFTLKELETLRTVERIPDIRPANTRYNGIDKIPTLRQDIVQVMALERRYHRTIGIVPEIKHSTFFRSIGHPMERATLAVLRRYHLDSRHSRTPAMIQSFEVGNLQLLHRWTSIPLVQLTAATGSPADLVAAGDPRTYADITSPAGLRQVARYATYLGPDKDQIVPRDDDAKLRAPTSLVADAHRVGLRVTPYTFRNENTFLPVDFRRGPDPNAYGDAVAEYTLFFTLGVDGVFSDNSDTAFEARRRWIAAGRPHRD